MPRTCASVLVLFLSMSVGIAAHAELSAAKEKNKATKRASLVRDWEFSFGTSQLFNAPNTELELKNALPTTSALFIAERFMSQHFGLVGLFNLPLTAERQIVDGELIARFAAPSVALGGTWTPLAWDFRETSRFEIQFALMGGAVLAPRGRFFPLMAARLHLLQDEGFALYAGTAFAVRVDTLALIYGIGHRF